MTAEPTAANYLKTEPIPYLLAPEESEQQLVEALLKEIAQFAHAALQADACSVFLVDDDTGKVARQVAGTGYQEQFTNIAQRQVVGPESVVQKPSEDQKLGLTSWILATGLPFLAKSPDELRSHVHHRGVHDSEQLPNETLEIQTFLGVPIRGTRQEIRGLVKAERRVERGKQKPPFSAQDESTLSNIAVATARCLDYVKMSLAGRSHEAVAAWTLDVISVAAGAESDLPGFMNVVTEVMAAGSRAESCSVFLVEENLAYLRQYGGYGYQAAGSLVRSYRMPEEGASPRDCEGLTPYIASSGVSFYAPSSEALKGHGAWRGKFDDVNFDEHQECAAFFGVPIRVGGTTIGVLKLENSSDREPTLPDPFPMAVRRQVSIIVEALGLAVLRLRDEDERRYQVMEAATKTINRILQGGGEVPDLVRRAIREISEALHAEACALFVREKDREGDRLVQYDWGAYGYASDIPAGERREYPCVPRDSIKAIPKSREDRVGLTVWIASMGARLVARTNDELKAHPHHKGTFDKWNFKKGQRCESFIGVPLIAQDAMVGVLKIENKIDSRTGKYIPFTKEDELAFDLLASSVANVVYHMRVGPEANRDSFVRGREGVADDPERMWALGLRRGQKGLRGFSIGIPPLPDDGVLVRTMSLGICGTDIQSFGGGCGWQVRSGRTP